MGRKQKRITPEMLASFIRIVEELEQEQQWTEICAICRREVPYLHTFLLKGKRICVDCCEKIQEGWLEA